MPNRILREGILTSDRVNALSPAGKLFYRRLMSVVDDFGRMELQPKILLVKCYPLQLDRTTVEDVNDSLAECSIGPDPLITIYSVRGKRYLQVNNFGQRERASKCPAPQDAEPGEQMRADDGAPPSHVREVPSDDGASPQSAAYARASNSTPTTPPNGFSSEETTTPEISLVPAGEFEPDMFEALMGLFIALGRGIGIGDRIQCENHWKGLNRDERRRAHEYAMNMRAEYQSRPTDKIPQPWNYLREKHWERDTPRLLLRTRGPTKAEAAHSEAARKFLESKA